MEGSLVTVLLQIFFWFCQWNKFENRSILDEVKAYKTVCSFWATLQMQCVLQLGWPVCANSVDRDWHNRKKTLIVMRYRLIQCSRRVLIVITFAICLQQCIHVQNVLKKQKKLALFDVISQSQLCPSATRYLPRQSHHLKWHLITFSRTCYLASHTSEPPFFSDYMALQNYRNYYNTRT